MKKDLQTAFTTRQYMLHKDFELYYYNDADLSRVRRHSHDYYEFYFFLEGDVSMNIDGRNYPLHPGDVILIPPGVPHYAAIDAASAPYRRFVFWISRRMYRMLSSLDPSYVYILDQIPLNKRYIYHYNIISFNSLQAQVFHLIEEMHSSHYGKDAVVTLRVLELIHFLNRYTYEQDHPLERKQEQDLYAGLIGYIHTNLDGDLSLERLAKEFYISKFHISHVFKDNLGISIHQYITKCRLNTCRDALLGWQKISDIYLACGFQDYSSFFRAFKKEFGMSPSEYRTLYRCGESELPSRQSSQD